MLMGQKLEALKKLEGIASSFGYGGLGGVREGGIGRKLPTLTRDHRRKLRLRDVC